MPVSLLDQKHPFYKEHADMWTDLHYLYNNGDELRRNASRFLRPRPKEPSDLLAARLARFDYEDVIGTIAGYYTAKLFREAPQIDIRPVGPNGTASPADLDQKGKDYFAGLMRNINGGGKSLLEELQASFLNAFLYKTGWAVIDRPNTDNALSYADQIAGGFESPKMLTVDPLMVYNWSEDADGNLEWVIISMRTTSGNWDEKPKIADVWYVFDRQNYRIYSSAVASGQALSNERAQAVLVGEGQHAMAAENRVPVRRFTLPAAYWVGNRLYLTALAHLNALNELNWALMLGCLSQIVIMSDDEVKLVRSESAYIKLSRDDKIATTEPSGTTFRIQQDNVDKKREEMYRTAHLMHMGRSSASTPTNMSGESKKADMTPSSEVLEGIGEMLSEFIKNVLEDLGAVRMKPVKVSVTGFAFAKEVTGDQITADQAAIDMGVPSETFRKEIFKKVALRAVPQSSREIRDRIVEEIDDAPTSAEQAALDAASRAEVMASALSKQVIRIGAGNGTEEDQVQA